MQVITLSMQKGGVGKTSSTLALAEIAQQQGARVLVIDLDPQASLTYILRGDPSGSNALKLLQGEKVIPQHTEAGLDLVPSIWDLVSIKTEAGSAGRLADALQQYRSKYDLCFIDSPPNYGELQFNTFQASDLLIVPIKAEILDAISLNRILRSIEPFKKSNKSLQVGVIVTMLDTRSTVAKAILSNIESIVSATGLQLFGTVRRSVAVQESQVKHKSLIEYAPKSKTAQDYQNIFNNIKEFLR